MRFSEICKECENKFVVETDDDLNPCFIGCLRCDIYEKIMKKPSNYEWMKHVYAFSPENGEFINPSKEFNFGILKDMIEDYKFRIFFRYIFRNTTYNTFRSCF